MAILLLLQSRRIYSMKYLFAWMLGVPGGLILLWFLFSHMH
jgi:hypothetical protein